jgi:peptide-methionine (S)-S-oxide reductase
LAERQDGSPSVEEAVFAGGCFWCFDAIFSKLRGVEKVESGYTGGTVPNPTYEDVCTGETGHAESVKITFNPKVISYRQLIEIFFTMHDPTTLNRQGADVGSQYRSAIFYRDEGQKTTAESVMREVEAEGIWGAPIVTELTPLVAFYKAEDYHQDFYERNPRQGYCAVVIAPKVVKFRKKYAQMLA